jgi:hypothetical protein
MNLCLDVLVRGKASKPLLVAAGHEAVPEIT